MAERRSAGPDRRDRRDRSGRWAPGAVAVLVLVLAVAGLAPGAAAQDDPFADRTTTVELGAAMSGETRAVSARAATTGGFDSLNVEITVTNDTDEPVEVRVPAGTLLASEEASEQTVVLGGPVSQLVSTGGSGGDTITAPPGESSHELIGFCGQELDYGPIEPTPLVHVGLALDPLPTVMGNIVRADPLDPVAAQDAVWWVTDRASLPVADPAVSRLLTGVDTAAFAADPVQVVPDDVYVPAWGGELGGVGDDGPGGSGAGAPLALVWVVAIAAAVGAFVLIVRQGSSRPATVAVVGRSPGAAGPQPGWYADPAGRAAARWWDGRSWTDHTSDR